jgi:hypothetical protein
MLATGRRAASPVPRGFITDRSCSSGPTRWYKGELAGVATVDTTASQDAQMVKALLQLCTTSAQVTGLALPLTLRPESAILFGRPVDLDAKNFDEKIRQRDFTRYCRSLEAFSLRTKFCAEVEELFDDGFGMGIREIHYLRVTRLGKLYLRLPQKVQRGVVYSVLRLVRAVAFTKRYKWVGSAVSAAVGVFGWVRTHDISGYLVVVAAVAGLLGMWIASWFHGGAAPEQVMPPDDMG